MKNNKATIEKQVEGINMTRIINAEYRRGFREGQQQSALDFAKFLDQFLVKFNDISVASELVLPRKIE